MRLVESRGAGGPGPNRGHVVHQHLAARGRNFAEGRKGEALDLFIGGLSGATPSLSLVEIGAINVCGGAG